ncbi:MAG: sulfatase-like hydrolase/transferase, partial [Planctomycetes bacterium]|nr:sulfatase-like hydrolase/transferase [Planctomycetota bacterium]
FFDLFPLNEIQPTAILKDDLEDCGSSFTSLFDLGTKDQGRKQYQALIKAGGERQLKEWTRAYLACVAFVDHEIGKILDAVDASPYKDNTIVVLTSDNGFHMGEKEWLYKNTCWEEGTRVILTFAGPGIATNRFCERPVSLIDIYPTLCDLCGLSLEPHAGGSGFPLDGFSLRPLLEDPEKERWDGPEAALSWVASNMPPPDDGSIQPGLHHATIRSSRFRYILYRNGEEELYDHDEDPNEWHNLAGKPEYAAQRTEMKTLLLAMTGRE